MGTAGYILANPYSQVDRGTPSFSLVQDLPSYIASSQMQQISELYNETCAVDRWSLVPPKIVCQEASGNEHWERLWISAFDVCGILWVLPLHVIFSIILRRIQFRMRNVKGVFFMWETSLPQADNTSFTCPDEDGAFGHCCLPAECPSGASPADCESQSTNGRRKSVAYVTAGLKKVGRYGRHGGVGDWWHCYFTYIGSSNIVYDILDPFLRIGWIDNIYILSTWSSSGWGWFLNRQSMCD